MFFLLYLKLLFNGKAYALQERFVVLKYFDLIVFFCTTSNLRKIILQI